MHAIEQAIDGGWTLLDSAFNYENEGAVGRAVRNSGRRDELIVTSKLPGRHHARDEAIATIEESLFRTGLDVLDLYLIHWPNPGVDKYVEAWGALIEARDRGLVKAIGVCNFEPAHLDRLKAETGELPQVNQIELHPYFPQAELLAYDAEHGIITEAWTPLGRGNDLLEHPVLTEVAQVHDATTAQVALAWSIALGALPLPKAASPQRQAENLAAPTSSSPTTRSPGSAPSAGPTAAPTTRTPLGTRSSEPFTHTGDPSSTGDGRAPMTIGPARHQEHPVDRPHDTFSTRTLMWGVVAPLLVGALIQPLGGLAAVWLMVGLATVMVQAGLAAARRADPGRTTSPTTCTTSSPPPCPRPCPRPVVEPHARGPQRRGRPRRQLGLTAPTATVAA